MDAVKKSGRDLKRQVLALLRSDNLEQTLAQLNQFPPRQVVNPLFSFLVSSDEQVKWRAITAMGSIVSNLAEKDTESARVVMRRLMWLLNDESGGIGWGAPEAMAEIIASHEGLAKEFVHVLISYVRIDGNFLEFEPLQRGAVWGIGRVAQTRPELVKEAAPHLLAYLESGDAASRGLAAWALGLLGAEAARSQLKALLADEAELILYSDRTLVLRTVGDLAKEASAAVARTGGPSTVPA
jgi:HEAT repeat protein